MTMSADQGLVKDIDGINPIVHSESDIPFSDKPFLPNIAISVGIVPVRSLSWTLKRPAETNNELPDLKIFLFRPSFIHRVSCALTKTGE